MGRPRKSLIDHVRDGSFIPSRHAHLLDSPNALEWVGDRDMHMSRLRDLARLHRIAESEQRRQQIAVAFQHAANRHDYETYEQLFTTPDGRALGWRATRGGGWALRPETKAEQRAREKAYDALQAELSARVLGGDAGTTAKDLEEIAHELARKHGVPARDALYSVQLEWALRTLKPSDDDDEDDDGFDPGL